MRILLVDDSSTVRMILASMLVRHGHEVNQARNGAEGWEEFQNSYFHVVITDWQMPVLDGLQLCAKIRAYPSVKYTYLILITAHGATTNYQAGIAAGADDFLQKPCDDNFLTARLMVAERIVGLQNHTKQLEALMSVCSYCRCIRDDADNWISMEKFASSKFGVRSSHGICPACYANCVKPELERYNIKVSNLPPSVSQSEM